MPTTLFPSGERRLSRRTALRLFGLGTAALSLTACTGRKQPDSAQGEPAPPAAAGTTGTGPDFSDRFSAFQPADAPNGDLTKVVWPAFILRDAPEIKALYEFQILNGGLMRYMPCFCGCQWEDNHRNNRDCYIERVNPDGSVVFDSMAPT